MDIAGSSRSHFGFAPSWFPVLTRFLSHLLGMRYIDLYFYFVFFTGLSEVSSCRAQGRGCEGKNHKEREVVTKLRFAPVSPLLKVLPLALPLSLISPLCSFASSYAKLRGIGNKESGGSGAKT